MCNKPRHLALKLGILTKFLQLQKKEEEISHATVPPYIDININKLK